MLSFFIVATTLVEVGEKLIIPIVLALIAKINWDGKKARKKAEEAAEKAGQAADCVRPNGSGHSTLTEMVEDVLIGQGKIEAKVDMLDEKITQHMGEPFHSGAREEMAALRESVNELKLKRF